MYIMHKKVWEGMRKKKNKLIRGTGGYMNQAEILTTQGSEKTSVWLLHEYHEYGEA